jgi:hypothetical protein
MKRDPREIVFAVVGALVLMGTFVFKEMLLDTLKGSMQKAYVALGEYQQYRRYEQLLEHLKADNPLTDESPHTLGRAFVYTRWNELNNWMEIYKGNQTEVDKLCKSLLASHLMSPSGLKSCADWQQNISGYLNHISSELNDQSEKLKGTIGQTDAQLKSSQFLDDADTALGGTRSKEGELEVVIRDGDSLVSQLGEEVNKKELLVTVYTYCTWILFGLGLALAVVGKIFRIPGVGSAEEG